MLMSDKPQGWEVASPSLFQGQTLEFCPPPAVSSVLRSHLSEALIVKEFSFLWVLHPTQCRVVAQGSLSLSSPTRWPSLLSGFPGKLQCRNLVACTGRKAPPLPREVMSTPSHEP